MLINLGGGVIGDIGGFCAATFKRGIRFMNIPTTLLSQVDASIGGKSGIDFGKLKNHIGVFREPDHVIVCLDFLSTLPDRELRSGFAEVIKHALIHDKKQWDLLNDQSFYDMDWAGIIPQSISIKHSIVSADPLEKGLRKTLNFGHTLGHAIESCLLETEKHLLHGEAVAIGMILEGHLSLQLKWITPTEFEMIAKLLFDVFDLPKTLPIYDDLIDLLHQDKKNADNEINFSLLNRIGSCKYDVNVSDEMIVRSLRQFEEIR